MASAQKRNPSRPGSATTRPGSAKDSTRNAQAQAAESGVFSIEELRLDFSERDISNAAKLPGMLAQVADSFNKLITLMSSISNFDDQFRKLEITANGTRYDLDALAERVKSFALKKDAEAFQQRTLEEEAVSRTKFDELFERVSNLELLIPRVDDHERRIRELENTIKAHALLLCTHGQILEEHGERLHTREETADQHAVSILNLQAQANRHEQKFVEVQEQFEERQRTREALIASLDGQFKDMNLRISQDELSLQNFKDATSNRLAQERKQMLGDVEALEKRVGSRLDSLRKNVNDNEANTVERLKSLQTHVNSEVERVEQAFNEKWVKLGNDMDRQTRLLKKSIEDNLKNTQVAIAGVADQAANGLQASKLEILTGQRKFEVEINKKVEVFKDTIKALGPEVEDIVRRETFDMMKEHLEDHSKHLKGLIDDKVGEDIIKQELAKKADVMALGAYTKKADADALVYNAMGEHAKQVEIFLMNTILDNPTKGKESGDGDGFGHEEKMRFLALESYSMKHSECISELYQMLKDVSATLDRDTNSAHYKVLRARPNNYITTRTLTGQSLTPVADSHGASLGYPHYMSKLQLAEKLTPRSGGSGPNSARSALQGWGGSMDSDRSHSSMVAAVEMGSGTAKAGGAGVMAPKAVSFAAGDATKAESVVRNEQKRREGEDVGLLQQRHLGVGCGIIQSTPGGVGSEDENADMIVLDMIEEELSTRGVIVSGVGANAEKTNDWSEPQPSIYESNSPQWKAAAAEKAKERSLPRTFHEAAISEEATTGADDESNAMGQLTMQTDPQRAQDSSSQPATSSKAGDTTESTSDHHAEATSSHRHEHGSGHLYACGHDSGQSGERGFRVDAGGEVVVPKLWGGGDARDREGTRSPAGRRTGGFTFEYKLTSGRHIPAAAFSSDFIDRNETPTLRSLPSSAATERSLPSSAATERARPPTADRARRPLSARPVGMVEVGGNRGDPVLASVNFPAAKKPRPLSASMIRHEEPALTRIGRGTETSAGGRGGGAAAAATGGHVPAPPSTSSPFLLNQAPPPATRLRLTTTSKTPPTLWFKPPAPSRAIVAVQELQGLRQKQP